jgi:non-ribosomal peptide synthetase component F
MVLLSAYAVLLGRYGATEDVVVGTPVAGRNRTELEGLIGFFVNTLVLRISLGGNPDVAALLARVRTVVLEALAHAELPFERLVEAINPPRTLAHAPLVQVAFVFHNQPGWSLQLPGLAAQPLVAVADAVKFDLSLHVARDGDGYIAAFAHDADVLPAARISRFAADWLTLLAAVVTTGPAAGWPAGAEPAAAPVLRAVPTPVPAPLPAPGAAAEALPETLAALRTIWLGLLKRPTIDAGDDFFANGGHSLLALRLLARVHATFGVDLPLATVFSHPTLGAFASLLPAPLATTVAPIPRQPRGH